MILSQTQSTGSQHPVNAMSVDVEDYFQVSAFEGAVPRDQWARFPSRVEVNVDRILALFDGAGVRATFFTLGCVAERFPDMVRRIVDAGHELASHGWSHVRVTRQDAEAFRQDVQRTRLLLQDLSGQPVKGYRAASYSIGSRNLWALEVLEACGYAYSSSIFPIRHDLYGMPDAPRFPFRPNGSDFLEIPVTTVAVGGRKLPCSGGGWFRLLPYAASRWAMRRVNQADGAPCVFYFHPWEIDPEQPRVPGLSAKTRFRHYLNLDRTEARLRRLLTDFNWSRMDETFLGTPDA
jgi:polysaccharide deacetylase family protein (PEP-CTERM system associated)